MAGIQKMMKAKLDRMMKVLNQNKAGRVYRVKCIDWGDSGYIQIHPQFDVEISPSTFPDKDIANIFLWRLSYDEKGRQCTEEVTSVRGVDFDKLDAIVEQWIGMVSSRRVVLQMQTACVLSNMYV